MSECMSEYMSVHLNVYTSELPFAISSLFSSFMDRLHSAAAVSRWTSTFSPPAARMRGSNPPPRTMSRLIVGCMDRPRMPATAFGEQGVLVEVEIDFNVSRLVVGNWSFRNDASHFSISSSLSLTFFQPVVTLTHLLLTLTSLSLSAPLHLAPYLELHIRVPRPRHIDHGFDASSVLEWRRGVRGGGRWGEDGGRMWVKGAILTGLG